MGPGFRRGDTSLSCQSPRFTESRALFLLANALWKYAGSSPSLSSGKGRGDEGGGMIGAIIERRLWAVFLFFLIFGPVLGMLYLNRGLMALGYLAVVIGVTVGEALWLPPGAEGAPDAILILIVLIGLAHGLAVAWRRDPAETLRWYARGPAVAVLLALAGLLVAIRFFVVDLYSMPAESMMPTLMPGDQLVASRWAYDFAEPERGDLIVFWSPLGNSDYVKRVAGLPGDKLQMKEGVLHINGAPVVREETEPLTVETPRGTRTLRRFAETLPGGRRYLTLDLDPDAMFDTTEVYEVTAGCYFVLGDNRDNSSDSRHFGCVAARNIRGKAMLRYWDGRTRSLVYEWLE